MDEAIDAQLWEKGGENLTLGRTEEEKRERRNLDEW
jgi:hypothetical protein